jgi:DNA repair photolyase
MNRYKEGFVDVRNPFNDTIVNRIYFDDVDLILFCTKNPIPILNDLDKIDKKIHFHITLTPYKKDIEPYVPPKGNIIEAIKKISNIIGIDNVYVRYDPIFLNDIYDINYHIKEFDNMCKLLDGYVKNIIISFIDDYKNVRKNMRYLKIKPFTKDDYKQIGINFSKSAKEHNMTVQTCFEEENLVEYGFIKRDCIGIELAYKLTGKTDFRKWSARKEKKCACVNMVDIGVYNSCKHFCKYCYANFDENKVNSNFLKHNENSSLLIGELSKYDIIKIRRK